MRTWYTFTAKETTPAEAELSIFDYIGYYGVEAAQFIADLKKIEAPTLNVSINSPGGDVFQAIAMMTALRNSGKTINMRVLGIAASAAAYMLLVADKRTMPENAMQMVHNASWSAYGTAVEMQDAVDTLHKVDANLQASFVQRTGKTPEEIAQLLSKDTYLTAAECLTWGLVDEVEPAMKMTAAFETDRLPEAAKAVFLAAQKSAEEIEAARVAAELEAAAAAAAETERVAAEAAAAELAAQALRPTAEIVKTKTEAAGLEAFTAEFALDESIDTVTALDALVAKALEIKTLCAVAKKPEAASGFITARTSLKDVRTKLCALLASADEAAHVDTAPKDAKAPVVNTQTAPVTTASVWASRK